MQDRRIVMKLGRVPFIGGVIESLAAGRGMTVREIRREQAQELADRRSTFQEELRSITGCDAEELSLDDLVDVFEESWTGERAASDAASGMGTETGTESTADAGASINDRSIPVVTMQCEYTTSESDTRSPEMLGDEELNQVIVDELLKNGGGGDIDATPSPNPDPDPDTGANADMDTEQTQSQSQLQTETPEQPDEPAQSSNQTQTQEVNADDD